MLFVCFRGTFTLFYAISFITYKKKFVNKIINKRHLVILISCNLKWASRFSSNGPRFIGGWLAGFLVQLGLQIKGLLNLLDSSLFCESCI
jgi:hypothetical protein